jgi:drug/metabolite transporter (DMT)-like permease
MHQAHQGMQNMQWTHPRADPTLAFMLVLMIPMVFVVGGGVLYHLSLRSMSAGPSPWMPLALAYGAACLIASLLWWWNRSTTPAVEGRHLGPAVLLAVAVIGIEAGYFFAYRAGLAPSRASIVSSVVIAVVLTCVGAMYFGEALSVQRLCGIALAGAGVWMTVVH